MKTSTPLTVSVIIPTYNRREFLRQTLDSLTQQSWPLNQFEVIVMDDGSSDDTAAIVHEVYPFKLRYFGQRNQGDAAARNTAAGHSQADVLVFLDDDVLVSPDYLRHIVPHHRGSASRIVVGTEILWIEESNPLAIDQASGNDQTSIAESGNTEALAEMPFAEICSNNMSIRREAYHSLGMMRDLGFPGSSMWCDVDFSYRAYQQGFDFWRSPTAICWHRDYVARSTESRKKRNREIAYRAAFLFDRYPELQPHIPMFYDMVPIVWGKDGPVLVLRKLARMVASTRPSLWSLEYLAAILAGTDRLARPQARLIKWIIGGHIYQGYQAGLRQLRLECER